MGKTALTQCASAWEQSLSERCRQEMLAPGHSVQTRAGGGEALQSSYYGDTGKTSVSVVNLLFAQRKLEISE